jgi:hypothetical protein
MTQDEIIEMARRAGVRDDENIFEFSQYKYLEAFAKLVADKEREACAKEVENALYGQEGCGKSAKAIRARGEV